MKINKRKVIILFLMMFVLFTVSGCSKEKQETVAIPDGNGQPSSEAITDTTDGTETESTKILPIYCLQEETLEREPVAAIIPEDAKIDGEFVVKTVVDTFAERSFSIGIDSVSSEEDTVIISFKKDKPPVKDVGSGLESGILDSISMSVLDNVKSCQKVVFRIEGEAYKTGHMLFEIDEPYKTLNK